MSIYDVDMSEEQILREECQGESWKKEEIGVGEYVRTKEGRIVQIKNIDYEAGIYSFNKIVYNNDFGMKNNVIYNDEMFGKMIMKHSKQLINVLEKGDMIITRENRIYKLDSVIKGELYCDYYKYHDTLISINIDEVSMILTKEQLEANCYKVGAENG